MDKRIGIADKTAILPVRGALRRDDCRATLHRTLHGLEQMGEGAAYHQRLGSILEQHQRLAQRL
jgi:hypothetical protein